MTSLRAVARIDGSGPHCATVLAVSIDGANVLLREKGKKPGRPAERPGQRVPDKEVLCCYKIAMVGSISFYKQVEEVIGLRAGEEGTVAQGLDSVYHAWMSEQRAPTFKTEFGRMWAQTESQLPQETTRVLVIDGARALWNYVQSMAQFAEYKVSPSGAVESKPPARPFVKERFCRSGMRWSTPGGQNVMKLRVLNKSQQ